MSEQTGVSWADFSYGPWRGCYPVSAGCANCYAARQMRQYGQDFSQIVRAADATFYAPMKWQKQGKTGIVFTMPWSDFFLPEADEWRDEAWYVINQCPDLLFAIVTKRPENIADRLPADWGDGWPNVILMVTAENQEMADRRIPILLQTPAKLRGVSVEPMLGPVDIRCHMWDWYDGLPRAEERATLNWLIAGCESGPKRRHVDDDAFRSLRDQCSDAGIPFYLKQREIDGKVVTEPELDGRQHLSLPWRLDQLIESKRGEGE